MISRLVITFLPPDGETVSSFTLQSNAIGSSSDYAMAAPSASPSPAPLLSSSCPQDITPQPIAIPENIAEAVRQGNQGPYNSFILGMISPPYQSKDTDAPNLLALCNSMFPTVSSTV